MSSSKKSKPVKASTYDWKHLRRLNATNPAAVDLLDFSDFIKKHGVDALDAVYPKHDKKGKIAPPPIFLSSGAKVRQWRNYPSDQQRKIIDSFGKGQQSRAAEGKSRKRVEPHGPQKRPGIRSKKRRMNDEAESPSSAGKTHELKKWEVRTEPTVVNHKPLPMEPCSIHQLESHVSVLQSEVDEYQELINVKTAEIERANARIEYLKSISTKSNILISEFKQDLRDVISRTFDAKIEAMSTLDKRTLQSSLKGMKEELIGKISKVNLKNEDGDGEEDHDKNEISAADENMKDQLDRQIMIRNLKEGGQLDRQVMIAELKERKYTIGWHHGKYNPLPSTWRYPERCTMLQLIYLWFIGVEDLNVPPLGTLSSNCVSHFDKDSHKLRRFRHMMSFVEMFGRKRGVWVLEPEEWNDKTVDTLWCAIRGDVRPYMHNPSKLDKASCITVLRYVTDKIGNDPAKPLPTSDEDE